MSTPTVLGERKGEMDSMRRQLATDRDILVATFPSTIPSSLSLPFPLCLLPQLKRTTAWFTLSNRFLELEFGHKGNWEGVREGCGNIGVEVGSRVCG